MNRSNSIEEFVKPLLVERIQLLFAVDGRPLYPERMERVKALPPEYLYRLLDAIEKIVPEEDDLRYATVDEACQQYLNDTAIAAKKKRKK